MEKIHLIEPTACLEEQYVEFVDEWKTTGELLVPFVLEMDYSDFEGYVRALHDFSLGLGLPEGFVPHTTYWLVSRAKIIGVSNLRHTLTESLLNEGGNIGYGIRPTERRKGFATILLRYTLEKAKEKGLSKVLVTCSKSNLGSIRTILNNNGKFDDEEEIDGKIVQRYWIQL